MPMRYHDPALRTERQISPAYTVRVEGDTHPITSFPPGQPFCALAFDLLDDLPPFERDDPYFQRILSAYACELTRMHEAADALRRKLFPQNADDERGKLLSIWESILTLPVAPAGVTTAERQALLLAHLRGRNAASGADWVRALQGVLGNIWSYQEGPAAYTITLYLPLASGTGAARRAFLAARRITPAHLDLAIIWNEGFIIGVGIIGEDRL